MEVGERIDLEFSGAGMSKSMARYAIVRSRMDRATHRHYGLQFVDAEPEVEGGVFNRRRSARLTPDKSVEVLVSVAGGAAIPARLCDLSTEGMAITVRDEMAPAFAIAVRVNVTMVLPGDQHPTLRTADIRNRRGTSNGLRLGLRFTKRRTPHR